MLFCAETGTAAIIAAMTIISIFFIIRGLIKFQFPTAVTPKPVGGFSADGSFKVTHISFRDFTIFCFLWMFCNKVVYNFIVADFFADDFVLEDGDVVLLSEMFGSVNHCRRLVEEGGAIALVDVVGRLVR